MSTRPYALPSGGEDELLARLRRRHPEQTALMGDDAALLDRDWAVTVDHQIAGVHFPPGLDPRLLARRLVAVSLSDLAASAAVPRYAFLTLATPPDFDRHRLLDEVALQCARHAAQLAGGDLARSDQVVLTLQWMGSRPPRGRWLRRSLARPGDCLWVGGTLGESAAGRDLLARGAEATLHGVDLPEDLALPVGLRPAARNAIQRHLAPSPQLELGGWLGTRRRAAGLDVSDGLALDLHRLCRASGVGSTLDLAALPTSKDLEPLAAHLGLETSALALHGGEDYVLLFALPATIRPPAEYGCHRIGRITDGHRILVRDAAATRTLEPRGWDHLIE